MIFYLFKKKNWHTPGPKQNHMVYWTGDKIKIILLFHVKIVGVSVCLCMCMYVYVYVNMWIVCLCACVCEHRCKCRGQKPTSGIFLLLRLWDTVSHQMWSSLVPRHWLVREAQGAFSFSRPTKRVIGPLLCARLFTWVLGTELRLLSLYHKHFTDRAIPQAHKDVFESTALLEFKIKSFRPEENYRKNLKTVVWGSKILALLCLSIWSLLYSGDFCFLSMFLSGSGQGK